VAVTRWALLDSLSEEDRQNLISRSVRRRFRKGVVIFHEGDPGDTLHLIDRGRVAVRLSTARGDDLLLRVIGAGGWFGDLSMIWPAPRNATIVALEDTETRVVQREHADEVRRRVPQFEAMLVAGLVAEVRRLSTALLDSVFVPVKTRLFATLVVLGQEYGGDDSEVTIPLTQEQIAQLVGTTRPTVNKHLQDAADAGLVSIRRSSIVLLDRPGIARRAH
jgi:CRP/FNR family transcriptional regulator, cyclic AMP receptor protein